MVSAMHSRHADIVPPCPGRIATDDPFTRGGNDGFQRTASIENTNSGICIDKITQYDLAIDLCDRSQHAF